jgi:8-oxo-dGTP pyrophosphatase MutT (NUDIX family)
MEPLMQTKREGATYVPYKRSGSDILFYLQKREDDAERAPGRIGTFGGGIDEGEEILAGLYREVAEELTYIPKQPVYFSRYEFALSVFHVFIEEVDDTFESQVEVKEGEYGKFFSLAEILALPNSTNSARVVPFQVQEYLAKS